MTALERWIALDRHDPLPSHGEIAQTIGIPPPAGLPGDLYAEDADLQLYWPRPRPAYENPASRTRLPGPETRDR